ncbi:DUF5694 domain-containing protein [Pedobacter nutrimenti]|jgi:hypothetical protein|nr:DUF5694 domain-containing protein [Pedobacter nutrimenti]
MKILIKTLTFFSLLFSLNTGFAQKIEIVVVGSSHSNPEGYDDFNVIISKLKAFKPDMVFGEYLSASDYKTLPAGNWAYDAFKIGRDFIARQHPDSSKNPEKKIRQANKSLAKFAYLHKLRMDLALDYMQIGDRGNAEYQLFVIENYMKKGFAEQEMAYYKRHFNSPDSLKKARLYRVDSEYSRIYFPLIYALGQNEIYPMDCQKYDGPWSQAWSSARKRIAELTKKANQDSTSAERKLMAEIDRYSTITDQDKKNMSPSSYTNMASKRYEALIDAWNFYGGTYFFEYPLFPVQEIKAMYAQWALRNENMCENVLKQAKDKKAKRIVIGVGAGHRKTMEDILSRDPDVKLVSYAEL